jgi:uncharacterized protein (DUF1778 family)
LTGFYGCRHWWRLRGKRGCESGQLRLVPGRHQLQHNTVLLGNIVMPFATTARINLRTTPQVKAVIERAATMMGATVSGFVLQNAYAAARRVVADDDSLMLSQQAFQSFVAACEKPSEPTDALSNLMSIR